MTLEGQLLAIQLRESLAAVLDASDPAIKVLALPDRTLILWAAHNNLITAFECAAVIEL